MDIKRDELYERQEELIKKGVELINELSKGLWIAKVDVNLLKEQDINARIMQDDKFKQLVMNIKKRGMVESIPFCVYTDKIEIVSGHHRVKASKEAGLKIIPVLLDITGLNKSQIVAKQLAHNAIAGEDDKDVLKQLTQLITDVDDMIESAVDKEFFEKEMNEIDKITSLSLDFEFKTIQFTFLPHQIKDLNKLIENIEKADVEYVANIEQFKDFINAIEKTQKFQDIKSVGTAIHFMIKDTNEKYDGIEEDNIEWVSISKAIGTTLIPKSSIDIIKKAIEKMQKNGIINEKNKWQFIEYMAAEYMAE